MNLRTGIKSKLILGLALMLVGSAVFPQVSDKGLNPPSNTYRSFQDASIVRDSRLNEPLDLLNDFYPSIEVVVTQSDNIRRRSDIEEEDLRLVVRPTLAYRTNIGRHQVYVAYSGSFSFHDELDQEDTAANILSGRGSLDLNRSWDLDLFVSIGNGFQERGISGSRPFDPIIDVAFDQGPDEVDYITYGADLAYGRKLDRFTAVLGFEQTTTEFTNNNQGLENEFGGRDRDASSVHLDLNYRIAANTSFFGRVERYDIDFDREQNSIDSEQTDYLLGVRWKPTRRFNGVLGIGRSEREPDDEIREGFDGSIFYGNLRYAINPFSVIDVALSRAVEEPGDDISSFYVSDLFAIGWTHALTEQLSFNAFFKVVDDDYDSDREDEFTDWGLGLDYAWKKYLTVGVFYGEVDGESNIGVFDYEDRYYGVRLRSDLRSPFRRAGGRRSGELGIEPDSFGVPKVTRKNQ